MWGREKECRERQGLEKKREGGRATAKIEEEATREEAIRANIIEKV
jgi:hypothetical protein